MTKTVVSTFGTFTDQELETLKKGVNELVDVMEMQASQRAVAKDILDNLHEELKIPKKLIRMMAKTQFKRNYGEVIAEQEEFSLLFEGMVGNGEYPEGDQDEQ
jgi:hypothetical protein